MKKRKLAILRKAVYLPLLIIAVFAACKPEKVAQPIQVEFTSGKYAIEKLADGSSAIVIADFHRSSSPGDPVLPQKNIRHSRSSRH